MVVALSDENDSKVSSYVEKHGLSIRVASGSDGAGQYKIPYRPYSTLIDAKGKVVWAGHPSGLSDKKVKAALRGANKSGHLGMTFTGECEGKLKKVASAAEEGDLGKALSGIRTLLADETFTDRDRATELEGEITAFVSLLESQAAALLEKREVVKALSIYSALKDSLKGLPEAEGAAAALKKIDSDDKLQDELKACELLSKANAEVERRGAKKAAKKFESIVKKYPGTKAAERAEKFLDSL